MKNLEVSISLMPIDGYYLQANKSTKQETGQLLAFE